MKWINKNVWLISIPSGIAAFLLIYFNVHINIPATSIITDPREIFVLIGSALTGPVGTIIVSVLASLYDPNTNLIPYIVSQHVFPALLITFLYKKLVYERLKMPYFVFGWIFLVFFYYFIAYIPIFAATYFLFPNTFSIIVGSNTGFYPALHKILLGFVPEFIYTAIITSLVWIALPEKLRMPLWGKLSVRYSRHQIYADKILRGLHLKNNFLSLRLAIWIILFSIIPLSFGALYVSSQLREVLHETEIKNRLGFVKNFTEHYLHTHYSGDHQIPDFVLGKNHFVFIGENYNLKESEIIDKYGPLLIKIKNGELPASATPNYLEIPGKFYAFSKPANTEIYFVKVWNQHDYTGLIEQFLYFSGFVVVLSLLITFLLAIVTIWLIISRPLNQLSISAEKLSEGDLSVRVKTESLYDEIHSLGVIFNKMVENLSQSREEILKAKDLAEKSDRLKTEFLIQISHEIRTPLYTMNNYLSLIQSSLSEKQLKEFEDYLNIIENANRRIYRTVDLLVLMSQLELNQYNPTTEEINLYNDLLKLKFSEFKILARKKSISFEYPVNIPDINIRTDSFALSQILDNILDNAVKFTEEGFVRISISEEESHIIISVEDSGIGISEEFFDNIYTPFLQANQGYTRKYDGIGLGLAVSKRLADLNNIQLLIESLPGSGTTVQIKIPR